MTVWVGWFLWGLAWQGRRRVGCGGRGSEIKASRGWSAFADHDGFVGFQCETPSGLLHDVRNLAEPQARPRTGSDWRATVLMARRDVMDGRPKPVLGLAVDPTCGPTMTGLWGVGAKRHRDCFTTFAMTAGFVWGGE